MVVCKFFLEGRCRFGLNCRNEHSQSRPANSFQQQFNQPVRQQYFQQQPVQQRVGDQQEINLESLLYIVKDDATNSVQGGQWLLSCYAPLLRKISKISFNKNEENLPGLMDYSPEELRWEAISSNMTGQFQDYSLKLQQLAQSYLTIQRALQNLDQATSNFIVRYERGENVTPAGTALGNSIASSPVNNITLQTGPPQFSFTIPPNQHQQSVTSAAAAPFSFQLPSQQPLASVSPFSFQLPSQKPPATTFSFQLPAQTAQQTQPAPFTFQLPQQPQPAINSSVQLQSNPMFSQTIQTTHQSPVENTTHLQLSQSALEQFKADKFSFGKIPRTPPSKDLR